MRISQGNDLAVSGQGRFDGNAETRHGPRALRYGDTAIPRRPYIQALAKQTKQTKRSYVLYSYSVLSFRKFDEMKIERKSGYLRDAASWVSEVKDRRWSKG